MERITELLENQDFLRTMTITNIILIVLVIVNIIHGIYINRKYIHFMKKIGNGNNIDEMKAYYTQLDNNIDSCIQKIGLVRYNAFKDVGSDLSFTIALLDRNDNGVILNGLYGSESSNIFAKPIKGGVSKYQLSEEEKEALEIAEQSKNFIAKHRK